MCHRVLTVSALRERLRSKEPPVILDVREAEELSIVRLEEAVHLPLSQFSSSVGMLDRNAEFAVLCHHGIRSAHAAEIMVRLGFANVWNVEGGIDAWARDVDPSMPRY